jgi:hypothetical protein
VLAAEPAFDCGTGACVRTEQQLSRKCEYVLHRPYPWRPRNTAHRAIKVGRKIVHSAGVLGHDQWPSRPAAYWWMSATASVAASSAAARRAPLFHPPTRQSGRCDKTNSAASYTSMCRSHDVTGFSAANVLAQFGAHYNRRRPHRALQLQSPRPDLPAPDLDYRRIRRRPVLGGLISEYERAA